MSVVTDYNEPIADNGACVGDFLEAEVVRLRAEVGRQREVLESGRVALGMLHRAIREGDPNSEISVRIRDIIVSLK